MPHELADRVKLKFIMRLSLEFLKRTSNFRIERPSVSDKNLDIIDKYTIRVTFVNLSDREDIKK